ncbi:MAG: FeoC-like transcriptional regulator [Chloroflexota bacterium]|nr:FeoC-like transcriptional regulator [Chloroflexota bacterium]
MLQRILNEFESASGGMSVNELGRRLDVERSALEGMIDYLVRKGRLQDDKAAAAAMMCSSGGCGTSCPGAHKCPFVVETPRTFSIVQNNLNLTRRKL